MSNCQPLETWKHELDKIRHSGSFCLSTNEVQALFDFLTYRTGWISAETDQPILDLYDRLKANLKETNGR